MPKSLKVKFKAKKGTWTVCDVTKLAPAMNSLPVVMPIGSKIEEEESIEAIARFIANHKVKFSINFEFALKKLVKLQRDKEIHKSDVRLNLNTMI